MRTHADRTRSSAAPEPHDAARRTAASAPAAPAGATHHFANVFPDVPVPRSGGAAIPGALRARMERSFGTSFSNVRVHQDGNAERLGALAYTRGHDVHVARGRFDASSAHGAALIGHELAHVVQQRAGRVAVPHGSGAPINANPSLEAEADRLGSAAARGEPLR